MRLNWRPVRDSNAFYRRERAKNFLSRPSLLTVRRGGYPISLVERRTRIAHVQDRPERFFVECRGLFRLRTTRKNSPSLTFVKPDGSRVTVTDLERRDVDKVADKLGITR